MSQVPAPCPYAYPGPCCSCRLVLPDGICTLAWVAEHPDGGTLEELGAVFGVTRERIRQIEETAIAKVQAGLAMLEAGHLPPPGEDSGSLSRRMTAAAWRALHERKPGTPHESAPVVLHLTITPYSMGDAEGRTGSQKRLGAHPGAKL